MKTATLIELAKLAKTAAARDVATLMAAYTIHVDETGSDQGFTERLERQLGRKLAV